jgi:hypothetical protein
LFEEKGETKGFKGRDLDTRLFFFLGLDGGGLTEGE